MIETLACAPCAFISSASLHLALLRYLSASAEIAMRLLFSLLWSFPLLIPSLLTDLPLGSLASLLHERGLPAFSLSGPSDSFSFLTALQHPPHLSRL